MSKGFEQFGSDNIRVRLGGIYALEGVMKTSEQYYLPVLEALSAFIRYSTQNVTGDGPPATDIQAALTVIGRLECCGTDLANAHIPKANLPGANLSGTVLIGADLRRHAPHGQTEKSRPARRQPESADWSAPCS